MQPKLGTDLSKWFRHTCQYSFFVKYPTMVALLKVVPDLGTQFRIKGFIGHVIFKFGHLKA